MLILVDYCNGMVKVTDTNDGTTQTIEAEKLRPVVKNVHIYGLEHYFLDSSFPFIDWESAASAVKRARYNGYTGKFGGRFKDK